MRTVEFEFLVLLIFIFMPKSKSWYSKKLKKMERRATKFAPGKTLRQCRRRDCSKKNMTFCLCVWPRKQIQRKTLLARYSDDDDATCDRVGDHGQRVARHEGDLERLLRPQISAVAWSHDQWISWSGIGRTPSWGRHNAMVMNIGEHGMKWRLLPDHICTIAYI